MKTVYLGLLLGSLVLASASPVSINLQQDEDSLRGGSNLVLIEGLGAPGDGWIQMAPAGSKTMGPSNGQPSAGLTTFPFSELGNTKLLLNMEHVSWVYSAGQETRFTRFGKSMTANDYAQHVAPPLHITGLRGSGFFEVTRPNGISLTLEGDSDYLFAQDSFSWMKLPIGANVSLLKD